MKVEIVKLKDSAILPSYKTKGSAGMDLHSIECYVLKSMERKLISTGIAISLPENFEAQIRPRSGIAINSGVTVMNAPGTIDSDYRGEIKVILVNLSDSDFIIKNGMRIAQIIISKTERCSWKQVTELDQSDRGNKGFGSTGT